MMIVMFNTAILTILTILINHNNNLITIPIVTDRLVVSADLDVVLTTSFFHET